MFGWKKYDKDGYDKDGYDKDGYDWYGYDREKIHRVTGTRFDEDGYDVDGFDKREFDKNAINKQTKTLFNLEGYDKYGYDKDGFDVDGFDEDNYNKDGKHKVEFVRTFASIGFAKNKQKLFLDSVSGDVHFKITAFQGDEKFAKMISGGNFDFYDNDLPAYILEIKFDKINEKLRDEIINIIRHSFPRKFQTFPSAYSIGAYCITDVVDEETASHYLKRLVQNYMSSELFLQFRII